MMPAVATHDRVTVRVKVSVRFRVRVRVFVIVRGIVRVCVLG